MKTLLILAALAAVPAVAQPPLSGSWQVGSDSYHIYYADLDTSTMAGRAALLARVEKAARKLCDLPTGAEESLCIADTIKQLGRPAIRQALAERGPTRLAAR